MSNERRRGSAGIEIRAEAINNEPTEEQQEEWRKIANEAMLHEMINLENKSSHPNRCNWKRNPCVMLHRILHNDEMLQIPKGQRYLTFLKILNIDYRRKMPRDTITDTDLIISMIEHGDNQYVASAKLSTRDHYISPSETLDRLPFAASRVMSVLEVWYELNSRTQPLETLSGLPE